MVNRALDKIEIASDGSVECFRIRGGKDAVTGQLRAPELITADTHTHTHTHTHLNI